MKICTITLALVVAILWAQSANTVEQGLVGGPHCYLYQLYDADCEYYESLHDWTSIVATALAFVGISFLRIPGPEPEIMRFYFDFLAVLLVPLASSFFVSWCIAMFGPLGGCGL